MRILDGIEHIHFAELTSADVVRHRLVSEIVDAYERAEAKFGDHGLMNGLSGRLGSRPRR